MDKGLIFLSMNNKLDAIPASPLLKSTLDRYRLDRIRVGQITVRYRFKPNAN